jgi:hypothetical protein
MNKREMLHAIVDKLMDLEESSVKCPSFSYHSKFQCIDVYVRKNKYEDVYLHTPMGLWIHLEKTDRQERFETMNEELQRISALPDEPVVKLVDVKMTEEKAIELGLINPSKEAGAV